MSGLGAGWGLATSSKDGKAHMARAVDDRPVRRYAACGHDAEFSTPAAELSCSKCLDIGAGYLRFVEAVSQ